MIGAAYKLAGGWRSIVAFGLGAAAVVAWSFSPWGAETKLDAERTAHAATRVELAEARADLAECEATRDREQQTARGDAREDMAACNAALDRARTAGRTIERIITRDAQTDETGAPVRGRIGAGELRDALGQPAATP